MFVESKRDIIAKSLQRRLLCKRPNGTNSRLCVEGVVRSAMTIIMTELLEAEKK
jgi:hypothetical protein